MNEKAFIKTTGSGLSGMMDLCLFSESKLRTRLDTILFLRVDWTINLVKLVVK